MIYLVIDTNCWYTATDDYTSHAMAILHIIKNSSNLGISLDSEGKVESEYTRNPECNEIFQMFMRFFRVSKINYNSSNLDSKIESKLHTLSFDSSDMPFVGLALASDKIIITEDSDYGKGSNPKAQESAKQDVLSYLTSLGLNILDYNESINYPYATTI